MILTKDKLLEAVNSVLSEKDDDATIEFIENLTDTVNGYEDRLKDDTDWKTKYQENDASWRKKYRERFFNSNDEDDLKDEDELDSQKSYRYEDLFKEN